MTIEIKIQEYLDGSEIYVKILKITALGISQLPNEYFSKKPYVFSLQQHNGQNFLKIVEIRSFTFENYLFAGYTILPKKKFLKYLKIINKAGKRLKRINKKIEKAKQNTIQKKEHTVII